LSSAGPPEWSSARQTAPDRQTLAAVLVPLFVAKPSEPPHVVLTRRRADLRRHAGEIAFPGGRRDPGDTDLAATALREAHEEIGLAPDAVELIGELPAISTFATNYLIHPFVGLIEPGQQWLVSPREVDVVLELPLAAVQQGKTRAEIERRGIKFEVDAFVLDGALIWGATFRILADLFERLRKGGPDGRPALAGAASC
jgi:8-oxo-dGTP pyrophosphatase MutT (NUDIX family)